MIDNRPVSAADGRPAGGTWRIRWWALGAVVTLAVLAGGGVAYRSYQLAMNGKTTPAGGMDDLEDLAPANPGYLGLHACANCHAERAAEFQLTRHFLACCPPPADKMPPGFDSGRGGLNAHAPGLRFEMSRSGGDFIQTAIRRTPEGEQRTISPIAFVYGFGGKADEIYFTWHGDHLYELPMSWLHPLNKWATEPLNIHRGGDYSRTTTPRCVECHNTWVAHIPGTENQYRRDNFIMGVTCERCHGPGRDHVSFHQSHPEATAAKAVFHPGRLTRARQMDLCGQCHSNATKRRGPAFSYRPGEPLEGHYRIAKVTHREDDHVADQVKYLCQSKCFKMSESLSCTTCHNPHRPSDAAVVRRSCLKCHEPTHCGERKRLPVAVQDNCVNCHMPQFNRIQVLFHTEDEQYVPAVRPYDHRIAVYPTARDEVLLQWYRRQTDQVSRGEADRLTRLLAEHWRLEAEKLRREYRYTAAIGALREALRFDPGPATREKLNEVIAIQVGMDAAWTEALDLVNRNRVQEAIQALKRIVAIKPDMAAAHGMLGRLYASTESNHLAVEHLKAVTNSDPDDPSGEWMLGRLALDQGRPEEAVAAFRRADDIEPFRQDTHYYLGLSFVKLGRWQEAIDSFRKVVTIDPMHAGGHLSLSQALIRQGKSTEALPFAKRAARLTNHKSHEVLLTLAEAYLAAGQHAEAEATAARALELPPMRDATQALQMRRRLEEIRSNARQAPK